MRYAAFLMQTNNRCKEAIVILNKLASDGYEKVKVNLLLSLAYEMDSDPLMAQKYKAKAFILHLRSLGQIPEPGHGKISLMPQSHAPQAKSSTHSEEVHSFRVESAPAYKN